MEDKIFRNISFYRLILKDQGKDVDPIKVFSYIDKLPFDEKGKYLYLRDGNWRLMHIRDIDKKLPLKIIIGNTRRKDLPLLEKEGIPSKLLIDDNEGLYEPTHAIIFPNNVVGVESNFYGPKATSLPAYIKKKAFRIVHEVELIPLMRSDFLEYISRIGEVKLVELKVHRDMTKKFEEIDKSFYHFIKGLKDISTAEYIGISLSSLVKMV